MKRQYIITALLALSFTNLQAQTADTTLDQLQVPASPAFNLLGISPNNIERPKHPTDFALSIGNSFFGGIPKEYAVEFAPYWVFSKKKQTFADFQSTKAGLSILQTATISTGTTIARSQIDSMDYRKVAIALKFSICRGKLGEDFKKWSDSVGFYLRKASVAVGAYADSLKTNDKLAKKYADSLFAAASAGNASALQKWQDSASARNDYLEKHLQTDIMEMAKKKKDSSDRSYYAVISQLKTLQSRTDFNRYGFKLDFATGLAMDYPDSSFQNCYVSRLSTWLTGGYETENGLNWLFTGRFSANLNHRFLNDLNKIVNNINIGEIDFGVRLYKDFAKKLTLSFELMGRKLLYNADKLAKNQVKEPISTDRFIFSLNYKVGKNQNLSFTYGKNFDNVYTKGGNLITALNLLVGFGSTRPVGGL